MSTFKKVILIVIIAILAAIISFLAYSGMFAKIIIEKEIIGPYQLVYKRHIGSYQEAGKIIDKVYNSLKENWNIEAPVGFGIYYDNPKRTHVEDLRSDIGVILDKKDYGKIPTLKKKYKVKKYSKTKSVVVEFPFKTELSIFIGIMRVYKKIEAYKKENKIRSGPIMEIYDAQNKKIIYAAKIAR